MMEINLRHYSFLMFQNMLSPAGTSPDHWESIRAKAAPLVLELIRLNEEMKPTNVFDGYKLVGYTDASGKKKLSDWERVREAQKTWLVDASTLKVGDHVWTYSVYNDLEMYINETDPWPVIAITDDTVYIEGDYVAKIHKTEKIFKAPYDWQFDEEDERGASKYWLAIADKMGI